MKQEIRKNVLGMWTGLKGLLVLLVILIHCVCEAAEICGQTVYPLPFRILCKAGGIILFTFFIISGYLCKTKKSGEMITKQYGKYLKIYLITMVCMWGAYIINNLFRDRAWNFELANLAAGNLYGAASGTQIGEYTLIPPFAMWFFMVLMNAEFLFYQIMKLSGRRQKMIIYGIPILFFLWHACTGQYNKYPFVNLPFYPVQTGMAVLLLYIGYRMKKDNLLFRRISLPWKIVFLALALFAFGAGKIDMQNNGYELGVLDFAGGICGSLILIRLYLRVISADWKLTEYLMWIGRRSMWLIPIHSVEWFLFQGEIWNKLECMGVYGAGFFLFAFHLSMIILLCICMEKMKKIQKVK